MPKLSFTSLCLVLIIHHVISQDSKPAETTQAPPSIVSSTTAIPIVPTDYICRACVCKDGKVDCSAQDLTKFFSKEDWAGLVEFKPISVDLSGNAFSNVTPIVQLPIEILNMSRCGIETIAQATFKDLQRMRVLDLSYNKLTSAKLNPHVFEGLYSPEEFEPLISMRTLSLAHNDLHSLDADLFEHIPELTELDLSGNPLKMLDQVTIIAISSLPLLKVLKLRSCQLKEMPSKFLHTPRYLEHLDLSDNKLDSVPQELEEATKLVFLNLNQNPIVKLEKDSNDYPGFPILPSLQELHMCNMDSLVSIGKSSMGGLQNLKRLHMSFNPSLASIHPKAMAQMDELGEMYDWPELKELYLQWNNLSEIDTRLVSRWDHLDAVEVNNNPFLCDCSTQWMVDVLVPVVDKLRANASSEMICQEPIEMRGYTMNQLHATNRHMRCVDKYGHRPERDGAILLGTLIGVLLAVPIMLTVVLLWRKGYFARCGFRGPADQARAFYKRAQTDEYMY